MPAEVGVCGLGRAHKIMSNLPRMIERDRDATESCDGTPALDLSQCVAFSDIA